MLKNLLLKKMLKSQGVPEDQAEMAMQIFNKNPELFQKIAVELKEKMDQGADQMSAAMEIMKKYESELKSINQ